MERNKGKMRFKTHKEIDMYYASQGLDIPKLRQEFKETGDRLDEAIRRVKRRKFLGGVFYNPFQGFGRLKPEVEIEWDKIK